MHTTTQDIFQDALREWRNTKRSDGLSPAEWYLGRRQRTHAAAHPSSYERINDASFAEHESRRQTLIEKSKLQSDKHSRPLSPLTENSKALLQNPKTKRWDRPVTISEIRPSGSYWVTDDYGGCTLRNRRFLRPIIPSDEVPAQTNFTPILDTSASSTVLKISTQELTFSPPRGGEGGMFYYPQLNFTPMKDFTPMKMMPTFTPMKSQLLLLSLT